ncbi:hypothetical protein [Tepidibacter hydrothermalis]|uniref:CD-NTase associated protein 4-like DNA endonuclease domain-containing protein n=1 Tax=Tepidibacter hydrothermalis TaxID=3036126 RepID=A0ABY8E780_9FIRM|nr:hypothetical protein [Tepidibacter hydrothermalis]WFD08753.1 hypothetical protein P4S50_10120 [Tepidibacter hydrothermalis]
MDSSTTVNIKGIKFQSYKVIRSLVKRCVIDEESSVYYAIERFDDDSIIDFDNDTNYTGQAKYYTSDFSINSDEVKKAIRHFFNQYLRFIDDKTAFFEFYTCASFKNENKSDIITKEEAKSIRDNKTCFLEILSNKNFQDYKDIILKVIGRIIDPKNPDKNEKYIINFLERIDWNFGVSSLDRIEQDTIALMKELSCYNCEFSGKEKFIFDYLVQKIEMKALGKNSLKNYIDYRDLKYAFRDLKENNYKVFDDASAEFSNLEKINSKNLESKILNVCNIDDKRYFNILKRNITRAKSDHSRVIPKRSSTFLYRIFEICDEVMYELDANEIEYSREKINEVINLLYEKSKIYINDRKQDFSYSFDSDDVIKNSILLLFNECYLDFV